VLRDIISYECVCDEHSQSQIATNAVRRQCGWVQKDTIFNFGQHALLLANNERFCARSLTAATITVAWRLQRTGLHVTSSRSHCCWHSTAKNLPTNRLKKSNEMQQYVDIYLLLNYSTCFGRPSRPSSGVHKTVVATSGTGHTNCGAGFLKHDQIRTRLRKPAPQIV